MNAKYPWIFVALFLFVALLLITPRPLYAQDPGHDGGVVASKTFTLRNSSVQSAQSGSANSSDLCNVTAELRWYKTKKVKVMYHWQHCTDTPTVYWELASIKRASGTFVIDTDTGLTTVYYKTWSDLKTGDRITLHTRINDRPQADVVTEFKEAAPIWVKLHTRQDSGGACFQFTGHVDPWGVFTAGDHSYVFALSAQDWETPWIAGPNQPTVDWHVQFYRDAALTQPRNEYWFNNVANPCYTPPPVTCDSITLSIPNGTPIAAAGVNVDVTIIGQHGSQYRIVDQAGQVVAGPSTAPQLQLHAFPDIVYQGQIYGEQTGWSNSGCQFQYGHMAVPFCHEVTLNPSAETPIPLTGQQVEVTVKGEQATQYRIVDDQGTVVAGPSDTALLSLLVKPDIVYQAQLYQEGYGWTTDGCTFKYTPLNDSQLSCERVDLSLPNESIIPADGANVQVTVNAIEAREYRLMNLTTNAEIVAPGANATFTFHALPNQRYQVQVRGTATAWTTVGCDFIYRLAPPPPPAACQNVDLQPLNGAFIPETGADVVVKVSALNAIQYRIVGTDGTLTEPGFAAVLYFHALPKISYQVQVLGVDERWSSEGCQFSYRLQQSVVLACTDVALSVPNGTAIAPSGTEVAVTVNGQNATRYQIVDEHGQTMAGPGGDAHMQIHAMPNVRYQAQVANDDQSWTTSGCDFGYTAEQKQEQAQAFCELRASHYGDPGGRSRIIAWVKDQPTPVAIEKVRINWNQKGEVTYPTKRQAGPWFTNSEFTLLSRPEVFDVGFGYYKYEAWVYIAGIAEPAYCWGDGNAPDHDNVLPDPGPFAKPNPAGKLDRGATPSRLPTVGRLPFDGGNGPDKVELILWAFEKEGRGVNAQITAIANEGKPLARLGMSSVSDVAKFDGLNAREGIVYGFQIGEHGPWSPLFCPAPDSDPTTITVYWAAGGLTWLSAGNAYGDCWWLTVAAALQGWVTVDESVATYNALQPIIDWNGHRNLVFSLAQSRETGLGPRMQDAVIGLQARDWQGPVVPTTLPADFNQMVEAYRAAQAQ